MTSEPFANLSSNGQYAMGVVMVQYPNTNQWLHVGFDGEEPWSELTINTICMDLGYLEGSVRIEKIDKIRIKLYKRICVTVC